MVLNFKAQDVKYVLGLMASGAIFKYVPSILIACGTTKGGGGVAGPLSSKRLLKGTFFLTPPLPYLNLFASFCYTEKMKTHLHSSRSVLTSAERSQKRTPPSLVGVDRIWQNSRSLELQSVTMFR